MSLNDGQASGTFACLIPSMCRCCTDKTLFTFVRVKLISFLPFTDCRLLKLQSGQQPGCTSLAEPRTPVCQKYYLPAALKEILNYQWKFFAMLYIHYFTCQMLKIAHLAHYLLARLKLCAKTYVLLEPPNLQGDNKKVRHTNWESCL